MYIYVHDLYLRLLFLCLFFACRCYQWKCLNLIPKARLVTDKYPGAIYEIKKKINIISKEFRMNYFQIHTILLSVLLQPVASTCCFLFICDNIQCQNNALFIIL